MVFFFPVDVASVFLSTGPRMIILSRVKDAWAKIKGWSVEIKFEHRLKPF